MCGTHAGDLPGMPATGKRVEVPRTMTNTTATSLFTCARKGMYHRRRRAAAVVVLESRLRALACATCPSYTNVQQRGAFIARLFTRSLLGRASQTTVRHSGRHGRDGYGTAHRANRELDLLGPSRPAPRVAIGVPPMDVCVEHNPKSRGGPCKRQQRRVVKFKPSGHVLSMNRRSNGQCGGVSRKTASNACRTPFGV